MGKYTVRQADRVTDRQNDSMTVWQNSRAAKEPALVKIKMSNVFEKSWEPAVSVTVFMFVTDY